ncbi:MAG: hypothetical protein DRI90_27105 [Deltaproteobacteria bacterium]|nr:MAG: hypothetical protein DRI90_27105 [Deltaproteobacteria bacterium]
MLNLASQWRHTRPLVRAEVIATAWETFSVLLFVSAVIPAAYTTPWPSIIFLCGLLVSSLLAKPLTRRGRRGFMLAGSIRLVCWPLGVTPLLPVADIRILVASCGFGLMAGGIRRAVYRRLIDPMPAKPSPVRLRADLNTELSENAMVAGIVGGHVMLLFSVAFLRTASKVVFRAWWEIIPALAILGTVAFTLAIGPVTKKALTALRVGRHGDRQLLLSALGHATAIAKNLSYVNLAVWMVCVAIGVVYFQPTLGQWHWPDAIMQLAFGSLFAWGVSFYQRGWHQDAVAPLIERLHDWTDTAAERQDVSIRSRMLSDFGFPVLFALALSLLASIGLYRTLGRDLPLQEDFNAILALCASFAMLVLAVGGVFMRAARNLSNPLSELAHSADRVAGGELDAAVPRVQGPIEVVGLGESIEDMREALARTIDELRRERAGLETHVQRRTAELRSALEELKQAQTALIQEKRMALIGELVASVAHEIHNPLNAIAGSVSSLERVAGELDEMLLAYGRTETLLPAEERQRLAKQRAALDIDGALEDLAGVVKVVQNATRRSVAIVANVRSFSRAPTEPIPADLHTGLAETLSLLRHRLTQTGIEVIERYGQLPEVICRAGEVNQVFMNLLTNAIHAVVARRGSQGGTIVVTTEADDETATVAISDNGAGVPAALVDQVFDPFFTNKPPGEGTGIGLSISREIVRRHGGTLIVERDTELGGGARFVCRLPLRADRAALGSLPGDSRPVGSPVR